MQKARSKCISYANSCVRKMGKNWACCLVLHREIPQGSSRNKQQKQTAPCSSAEGRGESGPFVCIFTLIWFLNYVNVLSIKIFKTLRVLERCLPGAGAAHEKPGAALEQLCVLAAAVVTRLDASVKTHRRYKWWTLRKLYLKKSDQKNSAVLNDWNYERNQSPKTKILWKKE